MRTCTTCEESKPESEYYLDNRTGRLRGRCKACHCSSSYESRKKRPHHKERESGENQRVNWSRLGVTPEAYQELLDSQDGVCAICKLPEVVERNGKPLHLAVDHDHSTGAVRGLLCSQCNTALGKFRDDISRLEAAIAYLQDHIPG